MYGGASAQGGGPGAARMGPWKAYWATGPGLGGCDWSEAVGPISGLLLVFWIIKKYQKWIIHRKLKVPMSVTPQTTGRLASRCRTRPRWWRL
jgi:hypothetical protein